MKHVALPVRLTGIAQVTWRHLAADVKENYDTVKEDCANGLSPIARGSCMRQSSMLGGDVAASSGAILPTNCPASQTRRFLGSRKTHRNF